MNEAQGEPPPPQTPAPSQAPQPPISTTTIPPQFPVNDGPTPDQLIGIGLIMAVIVAGIVLFPLFRAWARRIEGRGRTDAPAPSPDITARLERIEQAVDTIALEVERMSEAQRYNARVLSELRGLPAPNPLENISERKARESVDRG